MVCGHHLFLLRCPSYSLTFSLIAIHLDVVHQSSLIHPLLDQPFPLLSSPLLPPSTTKMDSSIIDRTVDTLLTPVRIAVSKPAQRAYLRTILFATAASILYLLAIISYTVFYYSYIPKLGISQPVYLNFDYSNPSTSSSSSSGGNAVLPPSGTVNFDSALIADQAYDIFISLHMPRSPPNLLTGNFMLDLTLLSSPPLPASLSDPAVSLEPRRPEDVLARSQRPAMLTYASELVSYAHELAWLPALVLGLKREEERVRVRMFEGVTLGRVPRAATLKVRSERAVMVYGVQLDVLARLQGLRWFMYNYRMVAFGVFTLLFWQVEVLAALVAWVLFSQYFTAGRGQGGRSRAVGRQRLAGGGEKEGLKALSTGRSSGSGSGLGLGMGPGDLSPQGQRTPREPTIKEEDEGEEYDEGEDESVKVEKEDMDTPVEDAKIEPLDITYDLSSSGEIIKGRTSGVRLSTGGVTRRLRGDIVVR